MKSTRNLRVMLLIGPESENNFGLESRWRADGYAIVRTLTPSDDLGSALAETSPDALVVWTAHPDPALLAGLRDLSEREVCPIVLYSASDEPETIEAIVRSGANAIAAGGALSTEPHTLIDVAFARFEMTAALRRERDIARTKLAERKQVERAKGILMTQRRLSEQEAYRLLQKLAMDRNEPLADIAERVIEASKLLN